MERILVERGGIVSEQPDTLAELAERRWRLALALTSVMLAVYFGFILLVAFDKPLMGTLILGDRVSVGIVLGALVIIVAPALIGIYVRWANRVYDPALHELARARREAAVAPAGSDELPEPPAPVARARAAADEVRP